MQRPQGQARTPAPLQIADVSNPPLRPTLWRKLNIFLLAGELLPARCTFISDQELRYLQQGHDTACGFEQKLMAQNLFA